MNATWYEAGTHVILFVQCRWMEPFQILTGGSHFQHRSLTLTLPPSAPWPPHLRSPLFGGLVDLPPLSPARMAHAPGYEVPLDDPDRGLVEADGPGYVRRRHPLLRAQPQAQEVPESDASNLEPLYLSSSASLFLGICIWATMMTSKCTFYTMDPSDCKLV